MDSEYIPFDQWHEEHCDIRLLLSADESKCCLSILPSQPLTMTDAELGERLKKHGINTGLKTDAIENVCSLINQGKPVREQLVAEGRPSEPAVPESIRFSVEVSTTKPSYEQMDHGKIDYHRTHLFENVEAGQCIGTMVPGKPGVPGCTVRGQMIPVPVSAAMPPLRIGKGVARQDDGSCVATMDGRVVFEENVVSISDELIIDGDVDYEVGDIDFVGFVHVTHSVREGYVVRARRGLIVDHVVENTHIESDGDIELGGMAGDGTHGTIRCGGRLTARYLHEVQVECCGDIGVAGEAMNCRLQSGGAITAALIAGGSAIALAGIESNRFGSDAGERTYLRAGVDYRHLEDIEKLDSVMGPLVREQSELAHRRVNADPEDLEEVDRLIQEVTLKIEQIDVQRREILKQGGPVQNAKINVKKALFDGVVIHLGHTQEAIQEYRSGACSIIEHLGRSLAYLPHTLLERNADELERALILQEQQER